MGRAVPPCLLNMIGDLVVDARLTFNKIGTPPLQTFDLGDLNVKLGVTGNDCIIATAASAAADATLPTGRLTSYGYVMLKNMYPGLIQTPGAPRLAQGGATGTTRYEYRVAAVQSDGAYTPASAAAISLTGYATLDAGHGFYVTWDPVPDATGGYQVYRTVGGGAHGQGIIAVVPSNAALQVIDNGINADGSTFPTVSPFDYAVLFGPSNTVYPILLKGGDIQVFRWNFAASGLIHYKMLSSPTLFAYMLVED
jgi:hypothetical protein